MVVEALALTVALVVAAEPLRAGEIELAPAAPRILLGTDERLSIELRGPADLSEVRVTTNHGSIDQLREVGAGRWQLELVAPPQMWPQVAIIAAEGRSRGRALYGVRAIPMWGSGEARVRTRPNAEVTVTIAGKTYGPIRADRLGIGRVPVVIPTGVRQGFSSGKALDLGLPQSSLVHVSLDRTSIGANAGAEVSARIYAVEEDGAPAASAPSARVTRGEITEPERIAPGVFQSRWALPAGNPGEAELSAWLTVSPGSTASARLRLLAGPPATVSVEVTPERMVAGETPQLRASRAQLRLLAAPARYTLSAKGGMASNLGLATVPSAAVEGGAWARLFGQNVGALAETAWFLVARKGSVDRGALEGRPASVIAHFVPLGASVGWWSPVGETLWLRATAGGGATLISSSAEIDGQPTVGEGQVVPSANASLAIGRFAVGPGSPFAEARLWWHGPAAASNNLDGALVLLSLTLGYRFDVR